MKIWTIAVRELKELARDTGGLVSMFVVPIAFIVIFNYAMGGSFGAGEGHPIALPVANLDGEGGLGARVLELLERSEWLRVEKTDQEGKPLREEDVISLLESGTRRQGAVIPADFSDKIRSGRKVAIDLYQDPAVPMQFAGPVRYILRGAAIGAAMPEQLKREIPEWIRRGMERFQESTGVRIPDFVAEKINPETMSRVFGEELESTSLSGMGMGEDGDLPVSVLTRQPPSIKREEFPTMAQQTASGYAALFVFFVIMGIGSSFLVERQRGTFKRILAAPVGRASYLVGKLLPYLIINVCQVALLFLVSILLFQIDLGSSPPGMLVITLCLSLSACGLGLLIATLFKTESQMSGMSVLIVLASGAVAGAMVPRFVMPQFMQQIGLFVPQTWAIEAYQDIMVRGRGLLDVLPACGVLLVFATVFFAAALLRFRFEEA